MDIEIDHEFFYFREYWICDQTSRLVPNEETYACGRRGMYVRGIEIDISISLQASPDWRHTKWDITHDVLISNDFNGEVVRGQPMFDYTPRKDCCNSNNRCCQTTCRCGTEHGLKEGECFNGDNKQVTDMTTECAQPNPCGKADEMHKLWGASIYEQLCKLILDIGLEGAISGLYERVFYIKMGRKHMF